MGSHCIWSFMCLVLNFHVKILDFRSRWFFDKKQKCKYPLKFNIPLRKIKVSICKSKLKRLFQTLTTFKNQEYSRANYLMKTECNIFPFNTKSLQKPNFYRSWQWPNRTCSFNQILFQFDTLIYNIWINDFNHAVFLQIVV